MPFMLSINRGGGSLRRGGETGITVFSLSLSFCGNTVFCLLSLCTGNQEADPAFSVIQLSGDFPSWNVSISATVCRVEPRAVLARAQGKLIKDFVQKPSNPNMHLNANRSAPFQSLFQFSGDPLMRAKIWFLGPFSAWQTVNVMWLNNCNDCVKGFAFDLASLHDVLPKAAAAAMCVYALTGQKAGRKENERHHLSWKHKRGRGDKLFINLQLCMHRK